MAERLPRVVIVGGGFAGLNAAIGLKRAPLEVVLVDRRNFHLFQPLLYQVATGALSPGDIATPLRHVLRRQRNTRVLLGEVVGFDAAARRVLLSDGALDYDYLVVAAGMRNFYFGNDAWRERAPALKSIEDATAMRARILGAFEAAEREADPERRAAWLRFAVIGAGPTGVELAGALAEIARDTLRSEFRAIDTARAEVHLIELGERVLPSFPETLSEKARASLERLGVAVHLRTRVREIRDGELEVESAGAARAIAARTVLWAAGVRASELGERLAAATGAALDRAGRIEVAPDLSVPGFPEVFVLGDLAAFTHQGGKPLPGVAPVAMQAGRHAARAIRARLRGAPPPPFRYADKGNLATIGRAAAVADLGPRLRFSGFLAWLLWLFVHLLYLVGFENRLLVLIQWGWNYLTWNRSARLITGAPAEPAERDGAG
jgi:NADH dehydrogenase